MYCSTLQKVCGKTGRGEGGGENPAKIVLGTEEMPWGERLSAQSVQLHKKKAERELDY